MSKDDELKRVTAERDLLMSAIRPEEFETIRARMVAISETPDKPSKLAKLGDAIGEAIGEAKFGG